MRSIGDQGGLDLTQDMKPPKTLYIEVRQDINGLVQDGSNFSALAMELLQSSTKPSIWYIGISTADTTGNQERPLYSLRLSDAYMCR